MKKFSCRYLYTSLRHSPNQTEWAWAMKKIEKVKKDYPQVSWTDSAWDLLRFCGTPTPAYLARSITGQVDQSLFDSHQVAVIDLDEVSILEQKKINFEDIAAWTADWEQKKVPKRTCLRLRLEFGNDNEYWFPYCKEQVLLTKGLIMPGPLGSI